MRHEEGVQTGFVTAIGSPSLRRIDGAPLVAAHPGGTACVSPSLLNGEG
jgi:hypothetical protein